MSALYGHRGAAGERPENTIEAFLYAKSLGLAGIECDVALTKDQVPVLHHDPELPSGDLIRKLTLEELQQAAPSIPSLAAALAAVPEIDWLIEIKTFPDAPAKSFAPEVMAAAVVAVVQAAGLSERVCILAFDWRVLHTIGAISGLRRVCLSAPDTERAAALWWGEAAAAATTPAAVARTGAYGWAAFNETLTSEQVRHAHKLGLKVFAWTVNSAIELQRLTPLVDGIISDLPSFCIKCIATWA